MQWTKSRKIVAKISMILNWGYMYKQHVNFDVNVEEYEYFSKYSDEQLMTIPNTFEYRVGKIFFLFLFLFLPRLVGRAKSTLDF